MKVRDAVSGATVGIITLEDGPFVCLFLFMKKGGAAGRVGLCVWKGGIVWKARHCSGHISNVDSQGPVVFTSFLLPPPFFPLPRFLFFHSVIEELLQEEIEDETDHFNSVHSLLEAKIQFRNAAATAGVRRGRASASQSDHNDGASVSRRAWRDET